MAKKDWCIAIWFCCAFVWLRAEAICPQGEEFKIACLCESNVHSTILDCSNCTGQKTIEMLKLHKAKLGLLAELRLNNCSLSELKENQFNGLFVKKLDLGNNRIATVDIKAFEGLKSILQTLIIRNNELKELPNKALNNMDELQHLDISGNHLSDIEENQQLINLPKLNDLNLANNRICLVHKDAFEMVKLTLQTLNLGRNCLSEVPAAAIRGFKALLALHVQHNNITAIRAFQFVNLPTLSLLNLAHNKIEIVQKQSFLNVPMIRFLYLGDNRLSHLEPYTFSTLENLELLDLSNNTIVKVANDTFSGIAKLNQLYMGDNRVAEIEPYAFTNSTLAILILAGNKLTTLQADTFQGLAYLQQLSLKENEIASIESTAFYAVPNLVILDLSHNKLEALPPSAFLGQPNMFLLDLSNNLFTSIPYDALNRRTSTIMLQENPLVCTERIHMIENNVPIHVPKSEDKICRGLVGIEESKSKEEIESPAEPAPAEKEEEKEEEEAIPPGIITKEGKQVQRAKLEREEIVYPVPIPFLTKGPDLARAFAVDPKEEDRVEDAQVEPVYTGLPAGIITVMPRWTDPPEYKRTTDRVRLSDESAKLSEQGESSMSENAMDGDRTGMAAFSESAKMTASICVGVVTALTLFVVGLLYFVRRKHQRQTAARSIGNNSRTAAYVAAQTYGCYNYSQRGAPEVPGRPSRQCDIASYTRNPPNWLFDPVCYPSAAYRP